MARPQRKTSYDDWKTTPPEEDDSHRKAIDAWVADAVEHLINCRDVKFKRLMHSPQGVTFERFALAVDEFVTEQLGSAGMSPSVIGRLVLHSRRKASSDAATAAGDALNSPNPDETLRQIAESLLRPLAKDALIAIAEDAYL